MKLLWGSLLDGDGMIGTPERVVRHWATITAGLHEDPAEPLAKRFPCDHDEIVLVKDVPFVSLCEHHLLPVIGVAHVAYIPQGEVVGLSKIPRALDILAQRPQLQERLNDELAQLIEEELSPRGVAVVIQAEHTCMSTRGPLKPGSVTVTSSVKGIFKEDPKARQEIMQLIKE